MIDAEKLFLKTGKFGKVSCVVSHYSKSDNKGFDQMVLSFTSPVLKEAYENILPVLSVTFDKGLITYGTKSTESSEVYCGDSHALVIINLNEIDLKYEAEAEEVDLKKITLDNITVEVYLKDRTLGAKVKMHMGKKDYFLVELMFKETRNEKGEIWVSEGNSNLGDPILDGFLRLVKIG